MVSPYIFILAVKILLIKINHTKNLRGILYAKKESRSETFADDNSIFIRRHPTYLRECVNILKQFANISGLQCNLEKTSVSPITSDKLYPELGLKWESEFTLLGFQIDSRLKYLDVNYKKCFERVHAISRKWARYQLSVRSSIMIAKTFMLPQFSTIASVLDLSDSTYDDINNKIKL